jgi:hypothetical protein
MSTNPVGSVLRVNSVTSLESLVGAHVVGEIPEVYWADSHGHFQFATEEEAKAAVNDPYYQQFLPLVDWSQTVIHEMRVYRPYCSDCAAIWHLVERASEKHGPLSIARRQGRWWAAFGRNAKKDARTAPVAICLAALDAAGMDIEIDQDRVDSELVRPQVADLAPVKTDDETPP